MNDEKKITAHFGHVVQRGNVVNILIHIAPDENKKRMEMRVSLNTETGQIIGNSKSILAFAEHFYLPLMESRGLLLSADGEGQASAGEIEKARADIANAIRTIDHYTQQVGALAVEVGADGLMNEWERVFSAFEKDN